MEQPRTPRKSRKGAGANAPTLDAIEKIAARREARRKAAEDYRRQRDDEIARNERLGRPGDVDFQRLIEDWRERHASSAASHTKPGNLRICIAARKRPISDKEIRSKDYDSVTCLNPRVIVHHPKLKVDGITKYLETQAYEFDHAFHENSSNEDVYTYTVLPLVAHVFSRGFGTCFAYGQTGSGKTYTMTGIQDLVAQDIFRMVEKPEYKDKGFTVHAAMFEIYGGRCSDLLHNRSMVTIREDGNNKVQTVGLKYVECQNCDHLSRTVEAGNAARTTHKTAMNDVSSRSHAIFELQVRDERGRVFGKLSLIDLAGSERASDRKHHNRQRRVESAEINKSLLALKECIRSLDNNNRHVPFRASKLTLVLKDSFTSTNSRVVMISAVSPVASSTDHTQNTLRYADRIKEKPVGARAGPSGGGPVSSGPVSSDIMYLQGPRVDGSPKEKTPKPTTRNTKSNIPNSSRTASEQRRPTDRHKIRKDDRSPAMESNTYSDSYDDDDDEVVKEFNALPSHSTPATRSAAPPGGSASTRSSRGRTNRTNVSTRPTPSTRRDGKLSGRSNKDVNSSHNTSRENDLEAESKTAADYHSQDTGSVQKTRRSLYDKARRRQSGGIADSISGASSSSSPRDRLSRSPRRSTNVASKNTSSVGRHGRDNSQKRIIGNKGHVEHPSSPVQKDVAYLAQTLREDGDFVGVDSQRFLELNEAVTEVVQLEEELLESHMSAIQENAEALTEEGQLLSKVQGDTIVDYDIDTYAERLEMILSKKLTTTKELLSKVRKFRKALAHEEMVSQRMEQAQG